MRVGPDIPRRAVILAALLLAAVGANGTAVAAPSRVASMNLCTDVLLYELAAAAQIASLSHLAVDPLVSYYEASMRDFPINHGHAEELLALAPDLVLASGFSPSPSLRLLERQGIPVAVIASPQSLAALPDLYRDTARLLGRPQQGEAYARRLAALAAAARAPAAGPRAVVFQANGLTYGADTLADDVLRAAGLRNLAAEQGLEGAGYLSLEELLHGRPEVVVLGAHQGWPSRGQALLEHPVFRRYVKTATAPRLVNLPERFWACPGHYLVEAVERLQRAASPP
ncbi:MAG: ABC transporter substrate-binding protein [Gammaproteobacteria bacterium]|nr:ABC transporter substrate-binding protein [Gammaproteobacteria bacterium]